MFHRAKSKEEYGARLILHVRQQSGGQTQVVGDMIGMGVQQCMMGGRSGRGSCSTRG